MPRRPRSWIVENSWKCTSCATQNRGKDMKCKSCGSPKEQDEKYSMGDPNKAVEDSTMLKQAQAGVNWTCSYCRFDNRALLDSCAQCGVDRVRAVTLAVSNTSVSNTSVSNTSALRAPSTPPTSSVPSVSSEAPEPVRLVCDWCGTGPCTCYLDDEPREIPTTKSLPSRNFRKPILIGLAALGVAVLIGFLIWIFIPHEHAARVSSIRWEYTKTLEERYTRSGSGWGRPLNGFNVHCVRRQHGTEDCHPRNCRPHSVSYSCRPHDCSCHQQCSDLGNGYSSCRQVCNTCYDTCSRTEYDTCYDQCPVYDNWCTYNYHEWERVREDGNPEVTTGTSHEVHWGTRLHADVSIPQRILTSEAYTVVFVQNDESWTFRPDTLREFRRYNPGALWTVETNYAGMIWPVVPAN